MKKYCLLLAAVPVVILLILACAKRSDPRQDRLDKALISLFEAHKIKAVKSGDWIELGDGKCRIQGRIASVSEGGGQCGVQLDLIFKAGDKVIVDSFGGLGASVDDAVENGFEVFKLSNIHVLTNAFLGIKDDQITVEEWTVGGARYKVFMGNIVPRVADQQKTLPPFDPTLISGPIQQASPKKDVHWMSIYVGVIKDTGAPSTEYRLDNETFPAGKSAVDSFKWPPADPFYSFRVFCVLMPE